MIRRSFAASLAAAALTLAAAGAGPRLGGQEVASAGAGARRRPVVGLALSGGGAKGFAHIGVLKVLEELGVPVDVVAGTSMGSLVGGLYAIGYRPSAIVRAASEQDWRALLTDERERSLLPLDRRAPAASVLSFPIRDGGVGLPTGVVRGERIVRLLERLTWRAQGVRDFRRLPIPFTAVATDIGSGEAVPLRSGRLAQALRASLAIPGVLRPERVEGRLLVDGAIARNLPAEDVRAMGADVVICSDVSDPPEAAEDLRSLLDVVLQTVTFQMRASSAEQRAQCDVLVEPDREGLSELAFSAVDEWVERGARAARTREDTLRALARRIGAVEGAPAGRRAPGEALLPERVPVRRIELRGVDGDAARVARRALGLAAPLTVTPDTLDRALARLQATDLFAEVLYHVEASPGDTVVVFTLTEEARDHLGFGFRYDDHSKASLLFSATLHNLLDYGSTTRFDLRLGEETAVGARTVRDLGVVSRFDLTFDARLTRALFDVYEGRDRVAQIRSQVLAGSGWLGVAVGRATAAEVGLHVETARAFAAIAPTDTTVTETFYSLSAQIWRDTFDRSTFPGRGVSLLLRTEWADPSLGSGAEIRQHVARVEAALPLGDRLALRLRAVAGDAGGADLPLHRRFHLGGAFPSAVFGEARPAFWGLEPQQRTGNAVQVVGVALQAELRERLYATAGLNAGNVFPRWRLRPEDWTVGWAVLVGAATPVGPLQVAFTDLEGEPGPGVEVELGFRF